MQLTDIIRRSSRSLKSAKGRTLLTAMAISVGTFALTLTLAASNGAQFFVDQIISENFDPAELIVSADEAIIGSADTSKPKEYDPSFGSSLSGAGAPIQVKQITDEDIETIRGLDIVDSVREDVAVNLQYITKEGQKKYVATIGALTPIQQPEVLAGEVVKPIAEKTVLLPEAFLESLGFSSAEEAIGQTLTLSIPQPVNFATLSPSRVAELQNNPEELQVLADNNSVQEEFTIAAVLKKQSVSQPGTELYLFTSSEETRRIYDITTEGTQDFGKFVTVNVRVVDGENPESLAAAQEQLKELGFSSLSVEETQAFLNQAIGILQGVVVTFGFIAVVASIFGIVNTMYISVLQRTREIGLMKALGMRKKDIGRLFRFEAAWIGFIGGLLGSVLAIGLGLILNPWISEQIGTEDDLLIFKPVQIVALTVLMIIISILAGWLPSRKAAKLDPIEALRTE